MADARRTPEYEAADLERLADMARSDLIRSCADLVDVGVALRLLVAHWATEAAGVATAIEAHLRSHELSDEAFIAVAATVGLADLFAVSEDLSEACLLETGQ